MKIETIGVITKNRPGSLAAVLPGYIENGLRFGRKPAVVVIDDSTDPAAPEANRTTLTRLNRRYGTSVAYSGLPERRRFAAALTAEGLERKVVRFALFGRGSSWPTFGAGRNALLLQTAGQAVFCPDDDVHCRLAEPPPRRGRPPASEPNIEEYWFFNDGAEALNAVRFRDEDVLALHERFLGGNLGGRKAWATLNGIVGDCALSPRHFYGWLKGGSRRRLLDSGENGAKLLSRQILRVARNHAAGPATDFTSIAAALDNRAGLPPFMPAHGAEDTMFAATAAKCLGGCVVHLPRALLHAPPEPRKFSRKQFWETPAAADRVNDFIIRCSLAPFVAPSSDPETNLRALGKEMVDFAGLPSGEFRGLAEKAIRRSLGIELLFLEKRLSGGGRTSFWGRSRRRYADNLASFIDAGTEILPRCLGADPARAWVSWQRLVGDFGRLALAWPDMVKIAKRLRRSGIMPAGRP